MHTYSKNNAFQLLCSRQVFWDFSYHVLTHTTILPKMVITLLLSLICTNSTLMWLILYLVMFLVPTKKFLLKNSDFVTLFNKLALHLTKKKKQILTSIERYYHLPPQFTTCCLPIFISHFYNFGHKVLFLTQHPLSPLREKDTATHLSCSWELWRYLRQAAHTNGWCTKLAPDTQLLAGVQSIFLKQ